MKDVQHKGMAKSSSRFDAAPTPTKLRLTAWRTFVTSCDMWHVTCWMRVTKYDKDMTNTWQTFIEFHLLNDIKCIPVWFFSSLVLCNNLVGRQNTPSPSWSEAPVKCQVKHGEGAPRSSSRWNSWKPHWSLKRWIHAMVRVCPWHRIPPPGDLKRPGSIRGAKPLRWVWYGHDMVVSWKEKQRNRLRKSRFWLHLEVEKVSKNLILVESRTVVEVSIKFNPYLKAVFASFPIWEPPARRKRVGPAASRNTAPSVLNSPWKMLEMSWSRGCFVSCALL